MRPDPARSVQEALIAAMPPERRSAIIADLRDRGHRLVSQQADAAGPMSEVERAMFILERLYPEMPAIHREQVRARLTADWKAGRWHGLVRPSALPQASP